MNDDYDLEQLLNDATRSGVEEGLRRAVDTARRMQALTAEPHLSLHAWTHAVTLYRADVPITALLAAALLRADTGNATLIRACWPQLAVDTQTRYDTPGGLLPSEIVPEVRS